MTSEQFAYWLQGFAELNEAPPSPEQWRSIRDHLALVFEKRTPVFEKRTPVPQPYYPTSPAVPLDVRPNTGTPLPQRPITTC